MANLILTQNNIATLKTTEMTEILKIDSENITKLIKQYNLLDNCISIAMDEYISLIEGKLAILFILKINKV